MKKNILVLCTGNSCRSHMAEGFLRHLGSDLFNVYSAGSNPSGYVHPLSIEVMQELEIDLSKHKSEHLDLYLNQGIDIVITVCGNANEACPVFPNAVTRYHWGFEDPPKAVRPEESEIEAFRRIRDQIQLVFGAFITGVREGQG